MTEGSRAEGPGLLNESVESQTWVFVLVAPKQALRLISHMHVQWAVLQWRRTVGLAQMSNTAQKIPPALTTAALADYA